MRMAGGVEVPENTIVTTIDSVVNWCRKYSLWPMPFATACCGIELMAVGASRFDISRFGAEVMRFSPRQCDLMIVAGRVAMKMMPVLQRIWLQMPEPKWCISMGACACSGGIFDTYAVVQGVDRFIPVDCYIPGCPPRPEQILRSLMDLQAKIQRGGSTFGTALPELVEREQQLIEEVKGLPVLPVIQERGDESRFGYRLPGGISGGNEPGPGGASVARSSGS
jgi:NADH-quinone oxidoreductase subunit B